MAMTWSNWSESDSCEPAALHFARSAEDVAAVVADAADESAEEAHWCLRRSSTRSGSDSLQQIVGGQFELGLIRRDGSDVPVGANDDGSEVR